MHNATAAAPFRGSLLMPAFDEPHFSIQELSKLWKISRETIRLLFKDEPGVIQIRLGRKKSMARYSIPATVAQRVHTRLSCPANTLRAAA